MSKYVARSITFFEICHLLPSPRVLGSSRCHNFSRREYGCKFQTFTCKKKTMSVITMQKSFMCPNTSRNPQYFLRYATCCQSQGFRFPPLPPPPPRAAPFLGGRMGANFRLSHLKKYHVSHYNAKNLYMSKYVARSIIFSEMCHLLPSARISGPPRHRNFSRREDG